LKNQHVLFGVILFTICGFQLVNSEKSLASRECTVYTDSQLKYSFNKSLFTLKQRQTIYKFIYDNALDQEAILLDLRYLGEHQCQYATILPNKEVRWPTIEDVEFAENLKPEDWFYIENNPKQRYYLLPRGVYTENLTSPVH
jgi:hypothetical protein